MFSLLFYTFVLVHETTLGLSLFKQNKYCTFPGQRKTKSKTFENENVFVVTQHTAYCAMYQVSIESTKRLKLKNTKKHIASVETLKFMLRLE